MLPSGLKTNRPIRNYGDYNNSPAKNSINRSSYSLTHRPVSNFNNSPRPIADLRNKEESYYQVGEKMRMMKSKIGNLSIQSRNGLNENNLYPA